MIVDRNVRDDFGRPAEASSTYLRYEVDIGFEEPLHKGSLGRLVLLSEKLDYITEGEASGRLRFPHSRKDFLRSAVINRRKAKAGFISTEKAADGKTEILLHQDGGSRGNPQRAPAVSAPRTIVATSNTSATPTILAARREMQRWRLLALEPSAMRGVDRFQTDSHISASGDHLPATLYRLVTAAEAKGDEAERVYSRIAAKLSELVPITDVRIDIDPVRQLLILVVQEESGVLLPARSVSDGTLRFLSLCILGEDPESEGLICMEEPENGIFAG